MTHKIQKLRILLLFNLYLIVLWGAAVVMIVW